MRGRLDGLLQGNHLGLVPGPGSEPGEARIYQPGDDVRRMDWAVTARTTLPHVRQTVADRELETWVVMDLSPSLDFGTAACEKRDLAVAALAAVTHLTARGWQPDRGAGQHGRADGADPGPRRHRARAGDAAQGGPDPARPGGRPRRPRRGRRGAAQAAAAAGAGGGGLRLPRRARVGAGAAGAVGAARAARDRGAGPARAGAARGRDRRARRPRDRPAARGGDHAAAVPGVRRGRVGAPRPGGGGAAPLRGRAPAAAHRLRLGGRHRAVRARAQAHLVGRRGRGA